MRGTVADHPEGPAARETGASVGAPSLQIWIVAKQRISMQHQCAPDRNVSDAGAIFRCNRRSELNLHLQAQTPTILVVGGVALVVFDAPEVGLELPFLRFQMPSQNGEVFATA